MKNHRAKMGVNSKIPAPPDLQAGLDAIIDYHTKYSMADLEKAGYLLEVPREETEELEASAAYQYLCKYGIHLKLARKDYARLSRLAAHKAKTVQALVKKWIKQGLQSEARPSTHSRLLKDHRS
jgi:hypothetical protein